MSIPPPTRRRSKSATSAPVNESDLRRQSQELGRFGSLFGSKEHAPIYFAGAIAILALIGLIAIGLSSHTITPERGDILKLLGGIVVSALTFLGGASGKSGK
jgi:hypothetical protein